MKYTAEQLTEMIDYEIEGAISKLLIIAAHPTAAEIHFDDTDGCVWFELDGKIKCSPVIGYCSDWSATGPLMVEYGIEPQYWSDGDFRAVRHFILPVSSNNPNPLRAICEVILMMGEGK